MTPKIVVILLAVGFLAPAGARGGDLEKEKSDAAGIFDAARLDNWKKGEDWEGALILGHSLQGEPGKGLAVGGRFSTPQRYGFSLEPHLAVFVKKHNLRHIGRGKVAVEDDYGNRDIIETDIWRDDGSKRYLFPVLFSWKTPPLKWRVDFTFGAGFSLLQSIEGTRIYETGTYTNYADGVPHDYGFTRETRDDQKEKIGLVPVVNARASYTLKGNGILDPVNGIKPEVGIMHFFQPGKDSQTYVTLGVGGEF